MVYRATKHSSTGFTPNMMLFGQELTEPIDLVAGMPPNDTSAQTPPQYVAKMRGRLELAHEIARDALGQSVERAKKQYDKRVARTHYKVGGAVWYLVKGTKQVKNKIRKFLPNYDGPYFILGNLNDLDYTGLPTMEHKERDVSWSEGSTVQQDLTGTVNGQMRGRAQRVRKPPSSVTGLIDPC